MTCGRKQSNCGGWETSKKREDVMNVFTTMDAELNEHGEFLCFVMEEALDMIFVWLWNSSVIDAKTIRIMHVYIQHPQTKERFFWIMNGHPARSD